jgi:hypothetical protein
LAEAVGAQLPWWTNGGDVTYEGSTSFSPPFFSSNLYAPEGTGSNDSGLFQTAIFTTTLVVGSGGGVIHFGGDDDTFLALNGGIYSNSVVDQVGGIHPYGTLDAFAVGQGDYTVTMFYADRHVTAAAADLSFSGDITAVPEISTWAMMLLGFAGLGFAGYRKARGERLALAQA